MTVHLAQMLSAIKWPFAFVRTPVHSRPLLAHSFAFLVDVSPLARQILVSVATQNVPILSSAIATSTNSHFASPAKALVAFPLAVVFSAGHHVAADLPTTPTAVVIRFDALFGGRFFAAITALLGTHPIAGRTGACVAWQLAGMGTFLGERPRLAACLTTRVGR